MGKPVDISVVIPVHARTAYLRGALESVVSQEGAGTLEVLVVDDGAGADLGEALEGLPGNIRVLRRPHGGVGAARQHGLDAARGRYVAFQDDDDLWLPGKLALQFELLEAEPDIGLAFTNLRCFDEAGDHPHSLYGTPSIWTERCESHPLEGTPEPTYVLPSGAGLSILPEIRTRIFFQTVLARRSFLNGIGGLEPRTRDFGDCLDLTLRATHGGTLAYIDHVTCRLRRGHVHMTQSDTWMGGELDKFMELIEAYPADLREAMQPWICPYAMEMGWNLFHARKFREARRAYGFGRRYGRLSLPGRVRWLCAYGASLFEPRSRAV